MSKQTVATIVVLSLGFVASLAHAADVQFIGAAAIPGNATDLSGLTDTLSGDFPHNRLGAFGSGIAYSGHDRRYFGLADRGPADGKTDWRSRVQALDISVDPAAPAAERVKVALKQTMLLTTESGQPLVGNAAAVGAGNGDAMRAARFDCEAIAVAADGTWYISDEYGPCIDHFSSDGRRLTRTVAPAKFVNPVSNADPAQEMPPNSKTGRQNNRGMEGLALLPDGKHLVAISQSPLLQDGALDDAGKRAGYNIRMLVMPVDGATATPPREFVYRLESGANGVNEILAVNDHEFLVIERDSAAGLDGKFRCVFRVDISHATDVSGVETLPQVELAAEIIPVRKRMLLDFTDPRFDLAGSDGSGMPEKIEGMTWGPDLPDGRRLLIVSSDNDFSPTNPTWIWAFAVRLD